MYMQRYRDYYINHDATAGNLGDSAVYNFHELVVCAQTGTLHHGEALQDAGVGTGPLSAEQKAEDRCASWPDVRTPWDRKWSAGEHTATDGRSFPQGGSTRFRVA